MWGASNVLTIASFSHDYITSSVLQMVKNVNFLDWLIDETHVLLVLCTLANAQIRILKYKCTCSVCAFQFQAGENVSHLHLPFKVFLQMQQMLDRVLYALGDAALFVFSTSFLINLYLFCNKFFSQKKLRQLLYIIFLPMECDAVM